MSIWGYCIVAAAIMLASALQASIGFGIGMLAAPIVALVDPALIPGTLIMVATLVTLMVLAREREDIDLHGAKWALVGRVPGTIAGALLLAMLPERGLAIMLALVVLVGVALTSFGWIPVARRRNVVLAGAASGVLGTATAIGGPPMALVWQRKEGARLAQHDERLLPRRLRHVDHRARGDGRRQRPHDGDVRDPHPRRGRSATCCPAA